ncbi:MAG: putative addiction module antidote protein [Conchiformibius sp.]|nr:putative addiction module antidote protein [Conchiformibius sp.]
MIKTAPLDVSKYLHDETDIALFLEAAAQEAAEADDHNIFLAAIAEATKAKGMINLAKETGIPQESIRQSLLPDANPRYEIISKVLDALGIQIGFTAKHTTKTAS